MWQKTGKLWGCCLIAAILAQGLVLAGPRRVEVPRPTCVLIPQSRGSAIGRSAPVQVLRVDIAAVLLDQRATTTMDVHLANAGRKQVEADLIVPLPDGAAVREFSVDGTPGELRAESLLRTVQEELAEQMP